MQRLTFEASRNEKRSKWAWSAGRWRIGCASATRLASRPTRVGSRLTARPGASRATSYASLQLVDWVLEGMPGEGGDSCGGHRCCHPKNRSVRPTDVPADPPSKEHHAEWCERMVDIDAVADFPKIDKRP